MQEVFMPDENICREVLSLKLAPGAVDQELLMRGITTEHMPAYQDTIKRMRNEKRRSTGFVCMAVGAFLGFLSCVLTITYTFPHMFDLIFYGITIIAVCIVVLGLYYVFE